MDPCESYVKEAKKKASLMKRDYWSAALLYIQAAECYLSAGNRKNALECSKKAAELLRKLAGKVDLGLVLPDLERALSLALRSAVSEKEKKKLSLELYSVIVQRGQLALQSGNYIEAANHFKRALEYAPTGEEAKSLVERAISGLEALAERKLAVGREREARRLFELIDEFRALLPSEEEIPLAPEKAAVSFTLSLTYTSNAEPDRVLEEFEKILMEEGLENIKPGEDELMRFAKGGDESASVEASVPKAGVAHGDIKVTGGDDRKVIDLFFKVKVKAFERIDGFRVTGQEFEGTISRAGLAEFIAKLIDEINSRISYNLVYYDIAVLANLAEKVDKLRKSEELKDIKNVLKEFSALSEMRSQIEESHAERMLEAVKALLTRLEE